MKNDKISVNIANSTVHYSDRNVNLSDVDWIKHPVFKGVHLKHMIKGCDSDGLFSSHLVKIDPDCSLETHNHKEQIELHEIIEGDGVCCLSDTKFNYHLGKMAVIPKGMDHKVHAGENGLIFFAKFFPPLL